MQNCNSNNDSNRCSAHGHSRMMADVRGDDGTANKPMLIASALPQSPRPSAQSAKSASAGWQPSRCRASFRSRAFLNADCKDFADGR